MTAAWVPLATTTLSSSAASVTFGSIPSGYRDLVLAYDAGNSANVYDGMFLRFNGVTTGYTVVYALGNGSGVISGVDPTFNAIGATGASGSAGIINIMDYSATDKHKTVLSNRAVADASGYTVGMQAGRWANTAAITTIYIADQSGYNFDAGSTFSLWGSNRL